MVWEHGRGCGEEGEGQQRHHGEGGGGGKGTRVRGLLLTCAHRAARTAVSCRRHWQASQAKRLQSPGENRSESLRSRWFHKVRAFSSAAERTLA